METKTVAAKIEKLVRVQLTLDDCTHCFAVPGCDSIIDMQHPHTGKTVYYDKTLAQVQAEYPGAVLMLYTDFTAALAAQQDTPIVWAETTREKHWEMLEVLPPALQVQAGFLVGEPWDHHATTGQPRFQGHRKCGDKFYVANRPMTRAEFRVELTKQLP